MFVCILNLDSKKGEKERLEDEKKKAADLLKLMLPSNKAEEKILLVKDGGHAEHDEHMSEEYKITEDLITLQANSKNEEERIKPLKSKKDKPKTNIPIKVDSKKSIKLLDANKDLEKEVISTDHKIDIEVKSKAYKRDVNLNTSTEHSNQNNLFTTEIHKDVDLKKTESKYDAVELLKVMLPHDASQTQVEVIEQDKPKDNDNEYQEKMTVTEDTIKLNLDKEAKKKFETNVKMNEARIDSRFPIDIHSKKRKILLEENKKVEENKNLKQDSQLELLSVWFVFH